LCLELVIRQEELGHPEQKVGDSSPYFVIFSFPNNLCCLFN
jgi:hypothetical protein